MKRKLCDSGGLALVETLACVAVLVLLGLMLNTGLQTAAKVYHGITAESETQLLLSTLSSALADDLRYARSVAANPDGSLSTYNSDTYGTGAKLVVYPDGQLYANGMCVLPGGAYGNGAYRVEQLEITYDASVSCFAIKLKVGETGGAISAQAELAVRCLNGEAEAAGGAGEGGTA